MIPRALEFTSDGLRLLDQRRLPGHVVWQTCASADDVALAIKELVVRGAPAIGIAAAYGLALAARGGDRSVVEKAADLLTASRPTAVNLVWAVKRVLARVDRASRDVGDVATSAQHEAETIHAEDAAACRSIGETGLKLLGSGLRILTHCNAGALATGGIGTALAPIYVALESGLKPTVYACEARPVMQGARLTAWELSQAGVDVTLLVDAAAAYLIASKEVDSVWVGADRIARNGDVANKVGTYGLACAAARAGVPFYVAAPSSTFDPQTPSGEAIAVEHRSPRELSERFSEPVSPGGIKFWTPAFDITPGTLVSAYVTEAGVRPGGRGQNS